jgi:hypothetical protein
VRKLLALFDPNVVQFPHSIQKYAKFANFAGYIFRILQHFANKLRNFTHFNTLFPRIYFFCQDKKLVYNGNCLFIYTQTWDLGILRNFCLRKKIGEHFQFFTQTLWKNLMQGIIVSNKTYFTESITNTTSSIVTLVSAIFVDKMICKRKCQSVGN